MHNCTSGMELTQSRLSIEIYFARFGGSILTGFLIVHWRKKACNSLWCWWIVITQSTIMTNTTITNNRCNYYFYLWGRECVKHWSDRSLSERTITHSFSGPPWGFCPQRLYMHCLDWLGGILKPNKQQRHPGGLWCIKQWDFYLIADIWENVYSFFWIGCPLSLFCKFTMGSTKPMELLWQKSIIFLNYCIWVAIPSVWGGIYYRPVFFPAKWTFNFLPCLQASYN